MLHKSGGTYKNLFGVYKTVYYFIMIAFIFVGFIFSSSFQKIDRKFAGHEALVVFSAFGFFAQKLFRVVATIHLQSCWYIDPINSASCDTIIESLPGNETIYQQLEISPQLYLAFDIFDIAEVIFQVPFLLYCQTVKKPTEPARRHHRRAFQAALAHLTLCNFSSWCADSFFEVTQESATNFYYGEENWTLLFNVVTPFTLFFRFNSMLLFLKAFLGNG